MGHVAGYKQRRRQCKKCGHQINDSLRPARFHLRKCPKVTLIQKKNYFGSSYEESDNETSVSATTSTSSKVILYFRSHYVPIAILRRHQLATYSHRVSLKLPVKTRWGSWATCLNSVIQNKLALKFAVLEMVHNNSEKVPELIKKIINDEFFWKEVKSLLAILDRLV
ncbi:10786_t:CDS:2, partial [Cetraspora pellucida]